ncbi:MAG: hypothetical protein ACI9S8_001391 [Chlamydiales bacterium]|jgi:hypothetical protein
MIAMFESIFAGCLITFLLLAAGSIIITTIQNGISPMPTSYKVKKKVLETIPPETKGNVYELGSGWGTLAFPIAKNLPHCHLDAYENSYFPYAFSVLRKTLSPFKNLELHYQDFLDISLKDSNLIICYLYPGAMKRLKEKMEKELTKECVVISHTFAVPGWEAEKVSEVDDLYNTKIYFYRFGTTKEIK